MVYSRVQARTRALLEIRRLQKSFTKSLEHSTNAKTINCWDSAALKTWCIRWYPQSVAIVRIHYKVARASSIMDHFFNLQVQGSTGDRNTTPTQSAILPGQELRIIFCGLLQKLSDSETFDQSIANWLCVRAGAWVHGTQYHFECRSWQWLFVEFALLLRPIPSCWAGGALPHPSTTFSTGPPPATEDVVFSYSPTADVT
jgi:hypothetical protein